MINYYFCILFAIFQICCIIGLAVLNILAIGELDKLNSNGLLHFGIVITFDIIVILYQAKLIYKANK